MYVCMCIYIYVYIYIYMHFMCVCIHMYIHGLVRKAGKLEFLVGGVWGCTAQRFGSEALRSCPSSGWAAP